MTFTRATFAGGGGATITAAEPLTPSTQAVMRVLP